MTDSRDPQHPAPQPAPPPPQPAPLVRLYRAVRALGPARGAAGAMAGVALTGVFAGVIAEGSFAAAPLLVPPIGASAVLVFAIPASPLAQPRSVILGNCISAIVGVSCALLIPNAVFGGALAVCLAILAMGVAKSLHPPGGAVALGAVLAGGEAGLRAYPDALLPVLICSACLVVFAVIYALLLRINYPHRVRKAPSAHATQDPPPGERAGYTPADLDAALARYGELLDVSRDDLDALFRQVELQAHQRLHAAIKCADIMSRDILSVRADQDAAEALAFMRARDLRTIPVIDAQGRIAGLARRAELQRAADAGLAVADAAGPDAPSVRPDAPIQSLLPVLSGGGVHEVMVVDGAGLLIGVITQTDLLAVLYRTHVVEHIAARAA